MGENINIPGSGEQMPSSWPQQLSSTEKMAQHRVAWVHPGLLVFIPHTHSWPCHRFRIFFILRSDKCSFQLNNLLPCQQNALEFLIARESNHLAFLLTLCIFKKFIYLFIYFWLHPSLCNSTCAAISVFISITPSLPTAQTLPMETSLETGSILTFSFSQISISNLLSLPWPSLKFLHETPFLSEALTLMPTDVKSRSILPLWQHNCQDHILY